MSLFAVLAITTGLCFAYAAAAGLTRLVDRYRYRRATSRRVRPLRRN